VCFENHAGLCAKRRTISRIMASFSSVSLVCIWRSSSLAQAPLPSHPCMRPFDNPATGSGDKPLHLWDNLEPPPNRYGTPGG